MFIALLNSFIYLSIAIIKLCLEDIFYGMMNFMAIKQRPVPEGQKQEKLFGFVGLKQPSLVEEERPKLRKSVVLSSYHDLDDGDGLGYRDMMKGVFPIVDSERLRFRSDAVVGFIHWILVCPTCNTPVEPCPVLPVPKLPDSVMIYEQKWERWPVFAKCEKCNMQYFIVELVQDRSFRHRFPTDDITLSIDFVRNKFA